MRVHLCNPIPLTPTAWSSIHYFWYFWVIWYSTDLIKNDESIRLGEEKPELLEGIVKTFGKELAHKLYKLTQKKEAAGGMEIHVSQMCYAYYFVAGVGSDRASSNRTELIMFHIFIFFVFVKTLLGSQFFKSKVHEF